MTASYFEKLFWSFIKNRFFGGILLFIKSDSLPLTIMISVIIFLEYYLKFQTIIVPVYAFLLMLIGFSMRKIRVKFAYTLALSIILLALFLTDYINLIAFNKLIKVSSDIYIASLYSLIFLWFLFNSIMLIVQIAEFFASTVGLYLLWGSDKKRIFLTPLPQLALLGMIYLCIKLYQVEIIGFYLSMFAIIFIIILIYIALRNSGRIIRSALAIYLFFEVYMISGYVYRFQVTQNMVAWVLLTLLATFFTAQGRAAIIAKEKTGVNGNILVLMGILLLISHALVPVNGSMQPQFELWWLLSLLATIIAPLGFVGHIMLTGRIKYYVNRDNTPTHKLFLEVATIVGSKVLTELVKILSSSITNLAKSFYHSDD